MGKSQRNKGAAGEREWTKMLSTTGVTAKRLLGQARDGGGDVPAPPLLWEVKRYAKFAVYQHIDQAAASLTPESRILAYDGCAIPAVALRGDNREWLVVLRATDALPLLYPNATKLEDIL